MSEVYESLMEGLNEALAFARGGKTGAVVHHVEVPRSLSPRSATCAKRIRVLHQVTKGTLLN